MVTPMRRQYLEVKRRYPHAILLFRLGDFYEAFDEDARLCSRELGLLLTARPMGRSLRVPMAGLPHHALEGYLAKLIARGYKVAICEQMGEGEAGRGLMERQVVRVVTPGTVVEENLLPERANNYLAALALAGEEAGIAYADISTGEFLCAQGEAAWARGELGRLRPAELLLPQGQSAEGGPAGYRGSLSPLPGALFDPQEAAEALGRHFGGASPAATLDTQPAGAGGPSLDTQPARAYGPSLEALGLGGLPLATAAAGALLRYLQENQPQALGPILRLSVYSPQAFMLLDPQTLRNLEVFEGPREAREGSLLERLDLTRTAMGARLLRRWLGQPLLELAALEERQRGVDRFFQDGVLRGQARETLGRVPDLERLLGRTASGAASPRDLLNLGRGLATAAEPARLGLPLPPCPEAAQLIAQAIAEEPQSTEAIRPGFSPELDELRALVRDAQSYLAQLERQERQRTGIRSLKVGYNKVFGYYIEVTRPHLPLVPAHYERRQTLVGAERFLTPELKDYELKILHAQEAIAELEGRILRQLCAQVAAQGKAILELAQAAAEMDAYAALAEAAARYGYGRPELDQGDAIIIKDGRHPMVEAALEEGAFVPNDASLSPHDAQVLILTGPNMAGKSTYLRQTALIVLMAQIGSFVPAAYARVGLVDRIFTRAGSQEDLIGGRSTFMVEMVETASILHNATPRSLLIFDEIGRGTSTYDGMAIARAVVEFLHNHPQAAAKTLFATHYHELADLASLLPRVRNCHTAVAEEGDTIVFLHKVLPGAADRSYGLHVAQLAGLPRGVVGRAQEVLAELEAGRRGALRAPKPRSPQLPLLPPRSPLLEELASLDLDSLTPLQALTKLYELRERARGE